MIRFIFLLLSNLKNYFDSYGCYFLKLLYFCSGMKHEWTYKKLGEVCNIICGQDYKSVVDPNGKYPIYGSGGIMGYASQCRCPAFSVIIGRKGNINNPLFVETDFWNVDTAFGVVANRDILVPKFLFYFAENYDFTRHDVSVTIPSLRRTDLLKISIPIPPISEQKHIVSELDLLTTIIEKKKEQLKAYYQLAQSIFYDVFGDPIENPKGWEVKKIGDTCTITCGQDYKSVKDDNGKYPIYGTGGIMGWANQYRCPRHSVIIGRKGNINNPILVDVDFWNVDTAFGVTPNKDVLNAVYFFFFCKVYDFTQHDVSVTIPSLRRTDIKNIKFPLPPLSLQQSFAEKIESIERQKSLIQQSIVELQTLFNSRMDKYFG